MKFVLSGNTYNLTKEEVESCMKDVEPERGYRHFVEVNERTYPVKQALLEALKSQDSAMNILDFTTQQARSILGRLGFWLTQKGETGAGSSALKRLLASLHTILSAMQEMHRDVGAPLGMTAAPAERTAFRGYLDRAKALSPDNKSIQQMGEPSDLLGELLIGYRALADFVAWEIEEAEGTTTD